MIKRLKLFLLAVSAAAGLQSANAYTCKVYTSYNEEYAESFDVIEARVVSIKRNIPHFSPARKGEAGKGDIDVFALDAVTLRVYRSYKHRVSGPITINDPHGLAAFPVEPNFPYLMFLRKSASNGEFWVDKCGASFPLLARDIVPRLRALDGISKAGVRH
jgi:hypothetical protein